MKKWAIEYKSNWSDGVTDYEQIIEIEAETKVEAVKLGKETLDEMDENDNMCCCCVARKFVRCVESENFSYLSSVTEDSKIYKNAGYIDVTKWKGL